MSVGQSVSDVLRTAIAWGTVALLGYLGFQLVGEKPQAPQAQIATMECEELEALRGELAAIKDEISGLSERVGDDTTDANRSVEDSFWVTMLVARYEGDEVHVYGRVRCLSGTWKSVKLSFIFRGHQDVKLYRHEYRLPGISATSPIDTGMLRKFDLRIPKFHKNFLEDNVFATVAADPVRSP